VHILLLRDELVIQTSYKEEEYKFYFSRKRSVYFNIWREGSVIQTSKILEEESVIHSFRYSITNYL